MEKKILQHYTAFILFASLLVAGCFHLFDRPAEAITTPHIYFGAYVNNNLSSMTQVETFETNSGKDLSIIHWFSAWGGTDGAQNFQPTWMNNIRAKGAIPMITWEPFNPNDTPHEDQPDYQLQDILAGNYDTYIDQWAADIAAWGHPLFLRFAHEMNGDWYPWAEVTNTGVPVNGNSQGEYIQVWRYIYNRFQTAGATNVSWVWCPNRNFDNSPPLSRFYPGDEYVDWLCTDGYNRGGAAWRTFETTFLSTYINLVEINDQLPIMIGEFGTVESGGSKADWFTDALTTQLPNNYPNIRAIVYFNANANGFDNRIETSQSSIDAFAAAISSSTYDTNNYGSLATNPIPPPATETDGSTPYVTDLFDRTASSSWGSTGSAGAYTLNGTAADYNVTSSYATMNTPAANTIRYAILPTMTPQTDVQLQARVRTDKPSVGSSQFSILIGRRMANDDQYRGRLRVDTGGNMYVQAFTKVSGVEAAIGTEVQLTGLQYVQGQFTTVKMQLQGTSPTTIRMKAWKSTTTEPANWQYTATDSNAALQGPGVVGLHSRTNTGTTNSPVLFTWDRFQASSIPPVPTNTPTPSPTLTPSPTNTPTPTPTGGITPTAVPSVTPGTTVTPPQPSPTRRPTSIPTPKPPGCSAEIPPTAPDLFRVEMTTTTAKLFFSPPSKPYTYYHIAYSENSNAEGNGVEFSTDSNGVISYIIEELEPSRDYFFKVRVGNGCAPGPWSQIIEGSTGNLSTVATTEFINDQPTRVEISQSPSFEGDGDPTNDSVLDKAQEFLDERVRQVDAAERESGMDEFSPSPTDIPQENDRTPWWQRLWNSIVSFFTGTR